QAQELGLVAKVFPSDQLLTESMKVASALATKGQVALRAIKQVVDRGYDVDLKSGCALEAQAFSVCFTSQDAREGVAAFLEKRKPNFQGSLQK
ncbi:MAG: enoyl-CoA hydratase-related protein, partial [Desulforhabdus sp.]|nr:enoyl-CoA hydratase-related protein [Desulforhabdus sp.]